MSTKSNKKRPHAPSSDNRPSKRAALAAKDDPVGANSDDKTDNDPQGIEDGETREVDFAAASDAVSESGEERPIPQSSEVNVEGAKEGGNANEGDDDNASVASGHSAHSLAVAAKSKEPETTETPKKPAASGSTSQKKKKPVQTTDWGYDDDVNKRINAIRAVATAASDTFYIARAPNVLDWISTSSPGKSKFYSLAAKGSKVPIKLWFLGKIVSTWFFENNGDPRAQITLNIKMLADADTNAANNIIRRYTKDRDKPTQYEDVRFSKWMTVRRPGDTRTIAETFSEMYDARDGLHLPRNKMAFFPPEDLKFGDLVLVEASVQRYHKHKDGNKPVYSEWMANYSINFVALLDDTAPNTTQEESTGDDYEASF